MIIHNDLKEFLQLLNNNQVEYVIVGGYAVAFHGFIRATKDIDILFRNSPENIDKLILALIAFGISPAEMTHDSFSEQGCIVRIGVPPVMIEMINVVSGVTFDTIWEKKVAGTYGDIQVNFISRTDLLANKKASGRPQDLRDIEELE